jgi:hypothetical protein
MSILSLLLDRIASETKPVMVFDLDSTLFSTQERNHAILREFSRFEGSRELDAVIAPMTATDFGWNVMDDLRKRGYANEETLGRLRSFWRDRFFRDDYLVHDQPLDGASDFVRAAHAAGAFIYYLTGRDWPNMGKGTRASLVAHGFPVDGERIHLHLKPRFEDDDLEFKRAAIVDIHAHGNVIAAFENEPANANLFATSFPGAEILFLETVHSPNPPPLEERIVRIKNFVR